MWIAQMWIAQMTLDWCVFVQDRLWRAHDAARCPDMKTMWAAKIRQYQRKRGVANHDEISSRNAGLHRAGGPYILLSDRKRGLK